ncbi:unnamed protein product [Ectocarpus fasciculatus]
MFVTSHAAAAAGTVMALISLRTGDGFVPPAAAPANPKTPSGSSSSSGSSNCGPSATTSVGSTTTGHTPALLADGSSTRQRRGNGNLVMMCEGGRSSPAAAVGATAAEAGRKGRKPPSAAPGVRRRPPHTQRQGKSGLLSAEATIERKQQLKVQELKKQLQRFASLRMWRRATEAFDKAKADGLPITAATYTHAINVMSKGGRWKEAIELLEEMIATDNNSNGGPKVTPSVVSYNAAITACSRANKVPAALRLLDEMSSRSGLSPDMYSYAAVMSGLAKARNPGRAIELLGEMRAAGMEPDLVCLKGAMEACRSKGAAKEAGVVLEQVRELDPTPSASTMAGVLTSAIAACVTEGAWEQATDWLTDIRMARGGALPPPEAYAAAANACARAGQGVRARALIAELENGGKDEAQRPTLECYNAVVLGSAMAGDPKEALRTLKEDVPKAGLKPNTQGFNHVLQGFAKAGDWKAAITVLDEQRSGAFPNAPPDRWSYNNAIEACGRAGQVEPAVALLDAMRAASLRNRRLRPCRYSYRGALQACRAAVDDAAALRLLEGMEKDGVKGDQLCSLAAFSAVATVGRDDKAAEILEDLAKGGVSTSEGALASAKEGLVEILGGDVGEGGRFARVMAAFEVLEAAQAEKAARKAKLAAADEEEEGSS